MKLTVFAGTFNPIHNAHLLLAEAVREKLNAEKILFIPSHVPPHREAELAPAEHRLNMVKLAIEGNPSFEVSDIEFRLDGKSYTLNTIKHLYRQYPDIEGRINFIIGTDAFGQLDTWYKAEELVELLNFVVLARKGSVTQRPALEKLSYQIVEAPLIEISSTDIRERIRKGASIKDFIPDSVEKYIHEHSLFCE